MSLECTQVLVRLTDLALAREFYVDKLGLEVIEEYPTMVAVRAGSVRFSIFAGGKAHGADEDDPPSTMILGTKDLDATMQELSSRGIEFDGEVQTAPGFMRYISLLDPDGNQLYIAQYLGDPLHGSKLAGAERE